MLAIRRHFRYEERDQVAYVTFERADRLNVGAFEVYEQIRELADQLARRPDEVRVLVLRGEGAGFCSGADLEVLIGKLLELDAPWAYDSARLTSECVRGLREMPQPVLAAVNGIAAGPGAVLALAADIRILAERASFQFLFPRVGIAGGDLGICWLLPRLIGYGRATELLLLGDPIDAEIALEHGIATRVVRDVKLAAEVERYVRRLKDVAPWGLAMTKEMLDRATTPDGAEPAEAGELVAPWLSAKDFREFRAGFLGKKRPALNGR